MVYKSHIWLLSLFLICCVSVEKVSGYEENVHRLINEKIYNNSIITNRLKEGIGINIDDPITKFVIDDKSMSAKTIMIEGGPDEDEPLYIRSLNHFHDPIKDWGNAGYDKGPNGYSSILWTNGFSLDNEGNQTDLGNDWSLKNAYDYYYRGLTNSSRLSRNQDLGKLFSALGHMTHLVADVSVPEHSRNDGHIQKMYENWCEKNIKTVDHQYLNYDEEKHTPDYRIYGQSIVTRGEHIYSQISNLFDSYPSSGQPNYFIKSHPKLAGLADYSNYNYFSRDTIGKIYDFPKIDNFNIDVFEMTNWIGMTYYKVYFKSMTSDDIHVDRLAVTNVFFIDLNNNISTLSDGADLDDECYKEYASNLLPRAVSYGVSLVNYFFRGNFKVTAIGNNIEVENLFPGDASGDVTIYEEDSGGNRKPAKACSEMTFAAAGLPDAKQVCSYSGTPNKKYLMVFNGKLRNEGRTPKYDHAVTGKEFVWSVAEDPSLQISKFNLWVRPYSIWASSPQKINLFTFGVATDIYFTMVNTYDGSTPGEPRVPTPTDNDGSLEYSGAIGWYLNYYASAGQFKKSLIRFRAYNGETPGPASDSFLYTLNLRDLPGDVYVLNSIRDFNQPNNTITVTSNLATAMYYTMVNTYNGDTPEDPRKPTSSDNDGSIDIGNARSHIDDGSRYIGIGQGYFDLYGSPGKYKRSKMRFRPYNSVGAGSASEVFSFSVDLR